MLIILSASAGSVGEYIIVTQKNFHTRFTARRHIFMCNVLYSAMGNKILQAISNRDV